MIVAGIIEEESEVANRVELAGAGINLRTATPIREQIRNAVREILADSCYRDGARNIQAHGAQYDSPTKATVLV